ncbi:hypothetical protein bhYOR_001174 (plasmid) [Borrelia nietonii YOR]|nr:MULTISPECIES: hypothetical protein [Borrelia]UPA09864.1 hypothetical protein bhYOR_001174 [Borrelia nietonii YOR]
MDIYNNKLKKLKIIMVIIILLNSCNFKDEALGSEPGKGDAMKKLKDARTPIQILLDDFNFSDEYKAAVFYIKKPLTDSDIGRVRGYKTYTDAEFYDLLVKLGKYKLKNSVRIILLTLRERRNAFDAIDTIKKNQAKKDELAQNFDNIDNAYRTFLKSVFNIANVDVIFNNIKNHTGSQGFAKIRDDAWLVLRNEM